MSVIFNEDDFSSRRKKFILNELGKKHPTFHVQTVLLNVRLSSGLKNCQLGGRNYKLPEDYILNSICVTKHSNANLNGAYNIHILLGSSENDRSPLRCSTVFQKDVVNSGGVSCLLKARQAGEEWLFINHHGRESGVTVEIWVSFLTKVI